MIPNYPADRFPTSDLFSFEDEKDETDDSDTKKETKEEDGPKPGRGGSIPNPADQKRARRIHGHKEHA